MISGDGNRGDGRLNRPERDFAMEGTGIWLAGANNYVRDNVVADTRLYGFAIFTAASSPSKAPSFQGADPNVVGQGFIIRSERTPILEFARNEAYGQMISSMMVWTLGADYTTQYQIGESVIKDFHAWNTRDHGFFFYPVNNVIIDGFVGRNSFAFNGFAGIGIYFADYLSANITIRNADIQGFTHGIAVPNKVGDTSATGDLVQPVTIENSYLRNLTNISVGIQNAVTGGGVSLTPRRITIRDVLFAALPAGVPKAQEQLNISVGCDINNNNNSNWIQSDQVFVYNYNRVSGDNFRVYYNEQEASFVIPKTGVNGCVGSPEAGLTNAENWAKYGIAFAGEVAPPDVTTRAGVYGLTKAI